MLDNFHTLEKIFDLNRQIYLLKNPEKKIINKRIFNSNEILDETQFNQLNFLVS